MSAQNSQTAKELVGLCLKASNIAIIRQCFLNLMNFLSKREIYSFVFFFIKRFISKLKERLCVIASLSIVQSTLQSRTILKTFTQKFCMCHFSCKYRLVQCHLFACFIQFVIEVLKQTHVLYY